MIFYERFSLIVLIVFSEVTGSRKKNICPRTVLPCLYVIDAYMKGLWVKVQTFQKIENGRGKFSRDRVTKTD